MSGDTDWWRKAVIYQIYPRSFADSNNDGIGDLRGITRRLDHIRDLGADAVWLSPFYQSPMRDFGYDVSDYCAVDPLFGTLHDFKHLLAEAHDRGIRVLVDFVPNHTSSDHPWFQESVSGRDNGHRDWYVWRDPAADGGPPNNWLSLFGGGPAWTFDERSGQYYLHSFLPTMPELNWRNPAVQRAMFDVVRFWLDLGVDGFRIDCAHFLMKDPAFRDNPPADTGLLSMHRPYGKYDEQIHLYDKGHEDVHGIYRDLRALLDSYSSTSQRIAIGEIHVFDWAEWATYYGADLDELHMPFNFGLLQSKWEAGEVNSFIRAVDQAVPPGAWPSWVLGNHDEPRIASRVGVKQARVAMLLLLTLRGTPTIYYGDELGLPDATVPPHLIQDPWALASGGLNLGRDPQRAPMLWHDAPHAGFTSDEVSPWLPLAADPAAHSVAAQHQDGRSMLNFTRSLLSLRRRTPALHGGEQRLLEGLPEGLVGYHRTDGTDTFIVLLNLGSDTLTVSDPQSLSTDGSSLHIILSTAVDQPPAEQHPIPAAWPVVLQGDEGLILVLADGGQQP
ncbi:alpha-amylase family glycosyl hydrolase [Streptomyces coacervatus]|uniref:Alpha-amylase family glycosyl hydrolase n=1 Tax=Streptomyces coacervatus TaxID=647381 RepID=A0ABP7HTJ4_9ACTN|nr:alpha-amylase family glycosyl hydrolase [Streptomyces coacervatus]MDF2272068.1 alpha-amylase family glycosyl hydrolase [Streptomyces coacervatus]